MKEIILTSKMVFQGIFFKIFRDRVRTMGGLEADREYIRHPGAALIIPLLDNGKVLMERQYRHAVQQVFVEFPAGKIDPGETSLQTAVRELKEETGYTATTWNFLTSIHPVIGYSDEKIDLYLAQGLKKGSAQLDVGEDLETFEVDISDLAGMIRRGELTDVKTQIAAFWLEKIFKKEWTP